ncbi:hypothetical protein ACC687_38830, partial [Rhizobium ruizarguesonis]
VDPWGAIVDWYRDLRVTHVKFRLIRDAAKFDGAGNHEILVHFEVPRSRAERLRLFLMAPCSSARPTA